MTISASRTDHRSCPVCGALVTTELWLILSRPERPHLWARARDGTLHRSRCERGHEGAVRAPLVLFDPGTGVVMYSAAPGESARHASLDRQVLLQQLYADASSDQRALIVEVIDIPRVILPQILGSPRANVANFAPGVTATPELEKFYATMDLHSMDAALNRAGLQPGLVAAVAFELALQLRTRGGGARPDPGERTIELLRRALRFYQRASFPGRWATAQAELALAYRSRVIGDAASNIQESIRRGELALEVFTADRYPEDHASSQINLANSLLDIVDRAPDAIMRAISAYEAALTLYSPLTYPESWALALSNLAMAYYERGTPGDLGAAAHALEQALTIHTLERDPYDWAISQMNLGLVLRSMSDEEGDSRWARAVASLRRADKVLSGMPSTTERLAVARNLGQTLMRSADRGDLQEAIALLRRARGLLLDGGDRTAADECTSDMARTLLRLIQTSSTPEERYSLDRMSADLFDEDCDVDIVGVVHHQVSLDLLDNESVPTAERRVLARAAIQRALAIFRYKADAERRAKALIQLGIIYAQGYHEGRREDKATARASFEAALAIATNLEDGPDQRELLGHLYIMRAGLDLPDDPGGEG